MSTVPEVISQEEIKQHTDTVGMLKEQMQAIKVTSPEELTQVAVHVTRIREIKARLTEARDKYITPAQQIIDLAKGNFNPLILLCDSTEKELKQKGADYIDAQEKAAKEKEEKELAKVESGYQKEDTAIKKIANIAPVVKSASVVGGTLGGRKEKVVTIVDASLIPDEYYKPRELDMVKINKVAKAGVVIPGVKVDTKTSMSFRG